MAIKFKPPPLYKVERGVWLYGNKRGEAPELATTPEDIEASNLLKEDFERLVDEGAIVVVKT